MKLLLQTNSRAEAESYAKQARANGRKDVKVSSFRNRGERGVWWKVQSNPTHKSGRAQQREATRKRAVQRRVAVALAKYLKQVNPSAKLAGAKVEKLKGGALKITPIKANAGIRGMKYHSFHNQTQAKVFMEEMRRDGYRTKSGGKQVEYAGGPAVYVVYTGGKR